MDYAEELTYKSNKIHVDTEIFVIFITFLFYNGIAKPCSTLENRNLLVHTLKVSTGIIESLWSP